MISPGRFLAQIDSQVQSAMTLSFFRRVAGVVLFLAVLGGLLIAVQLVPEWQVRRASVRSAVVNPEAKTTPTEVAALQNEMRKTDLQVVGGFFAIIALIFTYRRVKVAEQGHITDRFTKAIEQLGALTAQNKPNVEVRLGAIYALERIALDSPRDHWTIMEVLTAYVRQNAPNLGQAPANEDVEATIATVPPTEIQAILTVLGRRRRGRRRELNGQWLDLRGSDLRGANFDRAHLEGASFREAHLEGAVFIWAHVEGASFYQARAEGARFHGAHLKRAHFDGAHVEGAIFSGAHVEGAQFAFAHAEGARFDLAHLEGASFWSAQLEGAWFDMAHAEGADFNEAHAEGASFIGAHLKRALFSKARLEGASFFAAHVGGAYFGRAHVGGADFQGAVGLAVDQFADAEGWEQAKFDEAFLRELRSAKAKNISPEDAVPESETQPDE